jgi:hypothetical protein
MATDQVRGGNGGSLQKALDEAEKAVQVTGKAPPPPPPPPADLYRQAGYCADDLERVADEADDIARLYQSECRKLAAQFRRLTDQYLVRLIGPK